MTRDEITTEVEHILGERDDLQARIHSWINISQKRIARLYPLPELRRLKTDISLVGGQKIYDVSTDWGITGMHNILSMRLIHGGNSWRLTYVLPGQLDSDEAYPEFYSEGKPRKYTQWGNSLELVDYVPNSAYTVFLRYTVWPSDDEIAITNKDDLLIAATCAWGYATLQENDDATYWANVTKGLWGEIVKDLRERPDFIPKARGFRGSEAGLLGEYWNNPFIRSV